MRFRIAILACATMLALARDVRAQEVNQARFTSLMNTVFGTGNWRQTGGYRTIERENQLRAEGALTVAPGAISRHSLGRPGAPGAYDLVVDGLSPWEAAARLRASSVPFRRLFPEGAHGTQGAHLHFEPLAPGLAGASSRRPMVEWLVAAPTPAEEAVTRLRQAALAGDVEAQLQLATAYYQGKGAPRDLVSAYVWMAAVSTSEAADPAVRQQARAELAGLAAQMKADDLRRARQFARAGEGTNCAPRAAEDGPVLMLGFNAPAATNAACRAD
jgi:hypothetical protein